jgi:hypothetical protein
VKVRRRSILGHHWVRAAHAPSPLLRVACVIVQISQYNILLYALFNINARVAQLVERTTLNRVVKGSSPFLGIFGLERSFCFYRGFNSWIGKIPRGT